MSQRNSRPVARRSFLKVAGAGVAATSLAGCRGSKQGIGDSLKIGVLAPAPDNNPVGSSIANGARLARDQINAEGGVLDTDVELSIRNTEGDPSTGQSRYQDLTIGERVNMTTGVFTSEVLLNIMDDIADTRTIQMTTGAATTEASRMIADDYEKYKYHFRPGPFNNVNLGQSLANFAENNFSEMGWNRVAVLIENYEWTQPIRNVLDERLPEIDAEIVVNRTYAEGTQNFSPLYDDIEAADADAAFVAMAHTGTPALVQWARGKRQFGFGGIHVPAQLPQYYKLTSRACAFTVTGVAATPNSELTPKTQQFVSAYKNKFESLPVYTGYLTWDAIKQYATVVEEAGTVEENEVITGLEESDYVGSIGPMRYNPPDHKFPHDIYFEPVESDMVYAQWHPNDKNPNNGTQQIIYPDRFKAAEYRSPPWVQ